MSLKLWNPEFLDCSIILYNRMPRIVVAFLFYKSQTKKNIEDMSNKCDAKMLIKNHLDKKAKEDIVFAEKYNNCGKTIDDCFNYILSEARKRGSSVCMTDDEVFGLAVHFFDELKIKVPDNVPECKVSVASVSEERITYFVSWCYSWDVDTCFIR